MNTYNTQKFSVVLLQDRHLWRPHFALNLRLVYPVIEHNQEFLEFLIADWIVYQILDHEPEDHILI